MLEKTSSEADVDACPASRPQSDPSAAQHNTFSSPFGAAAAPGAGLQGVGEDLSCGPEGGAGVGEAGCEVAQASWRGDVARLR